MLSNKWIVLLVTAAAPCIWGTTYLVTAEFLPPGRPLLAAALRSLPAGLLLLLIVRRLPRGGWWWKALTLGALNIGVFFALLFIAAYRLPGGVAATVGAVQPLLVSAFAAWWIGERLSIKKIVLGGVGLAGVALLVLQAEARLDALGVACALGGAVAMAVGVVLSKKWGQPDTLLATTSWQLIGGGIMLTPLALLVEGPLPDSFSPANVLGYLYLGIIGTAVAYTIWFGGVHRMPASTTALLGLLSPLVASLAGWIVLHESLAPGQFVGAAIVLATLIAAGANHGSRGGPSGVAATTGPPETKNRWKSSGARTKSATSNP